MGIINQMMVDIETLGNSSNSVLLSIGAVMFDIQTGETSEQFRVDIDPESCVKAGLHMDVSTVMWWLSQPKESQGSVVKSGGATLNEALDAFAKFINEHSPDGIWGNGARFDLGIIENAYHAIGQPTPWPFWTERDVRTLVSFAPDVKKSIVNDLPHDPISDCLYQIKYCSAIYRNILGTKE